MRVYYVENSLHGKPYESKVVKTDHFNFVMDNNNPNIVSLHNETKFFKKIKRWFLPTFKHAFIMKEGIWWADLYLPNSIIFYDNENIAGFKGNFYFIAQIEDQLEIRKFSSNKPVPYKEVAYMHSRIEESKIIKKMERSFAKLLEIKGLEVPAK